MSNDNKRKLYDALSQDYDMGTYEQFCKDIQDEAKRKKLYDATSEAYDYGDYAKFSSQLGFGTQTTTPSSTPATPVEDVKPEKPATQPKKQQTWQPTPMQKAFMMGSIQSSLDRFKAQSDASLERAKNVSDYYRRGGAFSGNKPVKGDMRYNPEKGQVEQTYLTPTGTSTADRFAAEQETRAFNDYVDNMTVSGQLRRAGRELTDLHRKRDERVQALHEKWKQDQEKNTAPLAAVLGAQTYRPSIESDPEYRSLTAAIHQAEKRVQTLQHENDRQEGKDVGFWRGFGEVVGDIKTWDFGYSGLMDAMTMLDATSKPSSNRRPKTDAQKEAEQTMLEQAYKAQEAQASYGQNDSFWNRAGVMTGEMLPFMLDFAIMGGAKSGSSLVTRNLDAILLRSLHKAAPKVARNKAVQWTTKALGAMPEDLLYRAPLMTNTVQGMKTSADIIDRKLGDVVIREDGTYDFSNDKTWGSAIWQGEANAIIENYSEMFGTHLEGVLSLKTVGKIADTFGAKRLSGILTKASNSELAGIAGTMQKHLNQLGVSDYFGEVGEEYYGQLWRTMLNLDDAYKQNPDGSRTNLFLDGQFHGDIWGGMALSMGLMGAGKYTLSAAAYGSMKHRVNKTDARAAEIFTPEVWEGWRARIDGTTNDKIGEIAESIVADPALTDEQRAAAMNYMEASLNLRGFNLASVARQRGGEISEEEAAADESYMDGYAATTPQEMNDVKRMLELQRRRLASALSEDVIQEFDADPIGALSRTFDPELKRIAADYVNAKQVYDGMIQRVRDDVDSRIEQSNAMIDSRINRETGMIQPATLKIDDRKVYIVNGTVSMYEDGTGVDIQNSSESIIIRDAETGKIEFADPSQFLSIDEGIDAEVEKEEARSQIIDEIALAAADNIDGVLSFSPGDSYSIIDLEGNQQSVSVLGQTVDENGMPIDGYVDIQFADGSIETVATSDLQQWADNANAQRVAQFDEERSAQRTAEDEAARQSDQSGLSNPNRRTDLMPDDYETPYDNRPVRAARYIESENGTGGTLYQDENGNDAVVIAAIDDNNYVGYFREYDEQGNPTNRWSAKFQNGSGIRENHRDMMLTAQELLPAGHELTEHTSVSTDGLRNLANQLKHGYELQYDEQGNIVTTEVAVNMMARDNALGLSNYEPGSIDPARVSSEEYKEAASRLIPYMEALGLSKFNIHWEDGTMYVDHPILKRADTPQQEVQPVVTENAETVPNSDENTEIPTENRDLATENVPKTENSVENVQQTADDGFIPIDPALINSRTDENGNIIWDEPRQEQTQTEEPKQSALSRVPLNEKGKPDFGAVDADTAWDAIVEKTTNEAMAQSFADNMVAASEAELKKAEKVKTKPTTDIDEFIAADTERIANIDRAKTALDHWKKVAGTKQRRQAEADAVRSAEIRKRAEEARVKAEQERAEREEAERIEREALNGVPDWSRDTPQDARARGYRRNGPQKVDRQENVAAVQGKEVEVKFGDNELPKGHAAIIDASALQPSHIQGSRNPAHFLDEAQPKERDDAASILSAQKIASNIRPEEITSSVTAYTGAPTVNLRGETIQGNSRSDALRLMYESKPEQAAKYKQYLIDHAADFGLTPEQISSVENPVLVNMLDVADDEAIRLGQFVAQDTESGGIERIKPKNAVQKMGGQLNMGIDPEILAIGSMMAVYHIEKGARKFAEYVKAMVADLGEKFPARYLKGFYKAAHEMVEDEAPEIAAEMDADDVVNSSDVASIISGRIDAMATAEMVVEEENAEQEREEAEKKLKEERNVRINADGSTTETINEGGVEVEVTRGEFIPGVYPRIDDKQKKPGKKKGSKPKQSEQKPATSQLDLFGEEEEQIINDVIAETTMPEPKPEAELSGDSAAYQDRTRQERDLVEDIIVEIMKRADMKVGGEDRGPLTMRDIKGMLENYNTLTDISATDLQELVERAMTILTRKTAKAWQADPRKGYDRVVAYYNMQPMLNARDSERLIKQQYSTPTPFGYVMGQFVNAKSDAKSILEPSAGNGALTIMFDPATVHVNDIDERRLENLRTLGYSRVTAQNGLLPFDGEKVDGILTNPPFGTVSEKIYDNVFKISSLEGQMAINALDSMKDGGRAAIIIGGNTSYRTNGSMNPKDAAFFGYLYSHYNVVDVINISGKALYARNGTGYDVRMILINGRKTGEFSRVYPPVKSKARAEQVTTFDELYKRVEDDIQQVFQMGRKPTDEKSGSGRPTDRGTSAPVGGRNNRTNQGTGERPDATGNGIGSASGSAIEQPMRGNGGSRPLGMDNGDRGNARGTDDVPESKSPTSGSDGGGSPHDDGGRGGSVGRNATSSRPNNVGERLAVKPDLTTEKVPYPNQSDNGFTLLSVVPAAQAEVLQRSLGEIGDVDQFLVDELGYSSKEELYSFLAAEQIDSVALAIHQMNKGNAFIIGDMTGVGKGRQGAALIRYGVRQGKCPIYFTQKPTLFTDNYRDLADIGSSELRPFIIASNSKDANIVDANGNVVHKLPSKKEQERVFNYIMQNGKLPEEYDYVLTTYDQIKNGTADYTQNEDGTWNTEARKLPKKSKGYTTADYNGQMRRDALARLAMGISPGKGNIAILDESHTVGGDSGCGRYMQMLTSGAYGVTFLSATFAKRADNMPIYAQRTAISEAGVKANELIEAIAKGGVTLQEIMSKQLVESGQMIRRERSFEGVTIDWLSVDDKTDRKQREQFNEVADIFNSIRNFQNDFIKPIIDGMNEDAAEQGATVGQTQGTKDLGVRNTPFASKMYNLVNQLLFALKVDAVADRVIENLRNGFKPVISFTNTMEGFLASAPKGVAMDEVPNFSLTLMRALDGVMRFTENDADQNSEGGQITVGQLSPEGQAAYNAVKDKIMNLSADLPISPMDAIRMKIEEAGYNVAEITGRTTQLNRTEDGRYIVEGRKDRDKKAAMRDFNSGKLDVLMINKSGSTGISLHASSKFEDQRQRVMVFAQFQSDINDEVQMRGRIDRSGQVVRGRYEYIMSTIPAEQRIQMMFKAKLKSLDANTTSSQKSKFNEMEIVDYLNKYGDEVVWEYMKEHPELSDRLGDPLKMLKEKDEDGSARTSDNEDTSLKSDCAGKISRYLAFLSVDEQDEIFREITEAYKVKIQLLDDAGENDLEITTMPLKAETKSKQIWHSGENPGSGNAFADNTYVEEVEVDVLKKPMKRTEIEEMTRKLMGDKVATATEYDQMRYGMKEGELNWNRYADTMISEINKFFSAKVNDALEKMKESGANRVSKAREKAVKDALKARGKGENTFNDQEIEALADVVAKEAQDKEDMKQLKRQNEINAVRDHIKHLLSRLRAGHIYVVPQDLKQATADMFTQTFGTFVGFKFNKSYTLGSSTAIFATLDGRRKVELALNDKAIETIIRCTDTALRYSPREINAISMDNWDSKVPTQTRQKRYIITGNLLQALVDTEKGERTRGNLISFSTKDGNTRQGILMSENFKPTDLRSSVPLRSYLKQIQDGKTVVSENGEVQIERISVGWEHRGDFELRVPKSKQRGGIYTMNPELLRLVDGHNFVSKGNSMVGYILPENLAKVVDMLSHAPFNITVLEESKLSEANEDECVRFRSGDNEDLLYRIREEEPPTKTGIGYKVFVLKNGMLYPPMVANPNGDATPVGVWLDADAAPVAGTSKTGRMQVKAGGKGTQGGSGKLAYRPGWHLGVIPYALQFNRKGESGEKELFPANFVWAEVEYADDIDYQEEAMSYGYNKNGKFQHSYAGLPRLPINGAYKYRTNPNPETDPWIITGAMKINRLLTPSEVDEMVIAAGREPQKRQNGAITDEEINDLNAQFAQREREGAGAYSDAEVSFENDPWSKAWGESIRTKRQQKQYAERERKRMRERAESLSQTLGVDIEVLEDASALKGKKQRAKGCYDTKTGKITVVISNHNSAYDMEATILHEAVAHHGLRELLGEHFDEFLDKVYEAADNGIKEQIDLLASRNGWNRRIATEEYLAGLAERTDFDRAEERIGGWFDKIKQFFIDMLFKAGFKHIRPGSIGDNELRYILWRSYQNLAYPGRYRAFEWEAEDVAMQYKLQVGPYEPISEKTTTAADEDVRFRDGDFTPRDRALAAQQYEQMLKRGSWQFREATQDSMLGLKTLYESILGKGTRIEDVAGYENAYLYENRMSSANNGEQHQYFSRFMKPLLESIHELCGSNELDRRILTDYMIAKHGLERNEYMRNEAAANGEETERDFAGLCGLTGEGDWQLAEAAAQQMVDDYESDHDTTELWGAVKDATTATLEKIYLSGLISEDTYNKVLDMYDFYIPLRGWDETTSDEVYGYLTSKDGPLMGSVFKTAEGRESKADDPIATIAMMADDAIRQGNRNIMKQRFLNFVHGNPSDLVSVNEMWLQHNDVTDEWEPVFADLQPDMTSAEVESEIAKFEAKMEALRNSEPDKYKRGRDARNIPYKVVRGNLNEHQVLVKRNGRTYVMTINGNPRAAQALNGLTNPNVEMGGVIGNMLKLGEYVNRHLSAFYTTRNPDFVVSNFLRDMLYSNCMTWVKENPRYSLHFHKNFGRVNPITLRGLLSKWENNALSDSIYLEKMFKEFMLNGGETGYTSVKDIEGHKRTVAKELKKQGSVGRKVWNALGMQLDLLNRSAENCARFAAFLTSREMGRTLDRSIHDAKEISVNFNKKGSGGKFVNATGQKLLGKIGSYLGGGGRIAFVFWNAGIQGMTNFGRAAKRNPGKAIGGAAALFTLGYVIPLLAQMLGGGDGDDDDKNAYYNLPEYVRRSNICFKAGEQWITIPLPIEYRAIYGMGELACGVISGNERYGNSELARQMAAQISQIMPLDMLEGGGGISPFIPSAFKPMTEAYILNKGWTGLPVYKDSPFNKNDPEWTKAYQSTDQHLVAFSKWLNETSGGNDFKKGAIDINPAKLEYLLSGTFGGVVSTTGKLKKMGETAFGDREFEWRNILLANRVVKSGDERTANRKLQNEYFKYLNEYEETNRLRKKYENAADGGILGYAEKADFLYNSPEYLRFEIFEKYKPDIDAIREEIKEETDQSQKKELQDELFATMRELVDELHEVDK